MLFKRSNSNVSPLSGFEAGMIAIGGRISKSAGDCSNMKTVPNVLTRVKIKKSRRSITIAT